MGETSVRKKHQREQVKRLLAQGFTKSEAADKCGVSRQSVIRWSKEEDFIAAIPKARFAIANADFVNELLEETDPAKGEKAWSGASLKSKNLRVALEKHRQLAQSADDMIVGLFPICQAVITHLHENLHDIPPRMLPQIGKTITDLFKVSKECSSRATTLEALIRHEEVDSLSHPESESLTDYNWHLREIQRTQKNLLKDCDYVRNKFLELTQSLDPDKNGATLVRAITSGLNDMYDLRMKALGIEELIKKVDMLTPTEDAITTTKDTITDAYSDESQFNDSEDMMTAAIA